MAEPARLRVRWLRTALANLNVEAEFIAQDNPVAAAKLAEALVRAVERLGEFPSL